MPLSSVHAYCFVRYLAVTFSFLCSGSFAYASVDESTPNKVTAISMTVLELSLDDPITHPFVKPLAPPPPFEQNSRFSDRAETTRILPLADGTPAPSIDDKKTLQAHVQKRMAEIRSYIKPPVSLVAKGNGTCISSAEINKPLCVAYRGTKEWVGTAVGVKRIDKTAQTVTIYSTGSGLATGQVEHLFIDSTGESVVALVRQGNQYVFSLFEAQAAQWKTMLLLPADTKIPNDPDMPYGPQGVRRFPDLYRVAITARKVAIFTARSATDSASDCICYDRATGKQEPIVWSENIRADFPAVHVNAAIGTPDHIYLGSDIGLLRYDIATKTWQRYQATLDVLQMVPSEKHVDTIAILSRPRKRTRNNDFTVAMLSLKSGELPATASQTSLMTPHGLGILSLSPDDMPWITSGRLFYKATPNRDGWQCFTDDGKEIKQGEFPKMTEFERSADQVFRGIITPVVPVEQIPDNAIIPLVVAAPASSSSLSLSLFLEQEPMRWMRQRLSRWLSPPVDETNKL